MQDTIYNETTVIDASNSGVGWPAIFAGAIAMISITMLLFPLGAALGLAGASAMPSGDVDNVGKALTAASVIWMIIVQWVSSGFGGYLTGRLRARWIGAHTHEVFFRDTAHGFLSWGIATLFLTFIVVAVSAPMMGMRGPMHDMGMRSNAGVSDSYDRGSRRVLPTANPAPTDAAQVEENRKAAAKASLFLFLSMMIGAFIATAAAALGGRHREVHYRHGRLIE